MAAEIMWQWRRRGSGDDATGSLGRWPSIVLLADLILPSDVLEHVGEDGIQLRAAEVHQSVLHEDVRHAQVALQ
eukprot:1181214-Prorocentrum_minimum.AAC.3